MGSLLANTEGVRRSWRFGNLGNSVTFTISRQRKLSHALAILIGIACGAVLGAACSLLLPAAAPEVSEPTEALTIIISLNAIFEFLTVAVNGYCLQSQVVLLGHSFGKLDLDRLRGNN